MSVGSRLDNSTICSQFVLRDVDSLLAESDGLLSSFLPGRIQMSDLEHILTRVECKTNQEVGSVGVERGVDRGSSGRSPLEGNSLVRDGGNPGLTTSVVFLDQSAHSKLDQIKREEPGYRKSHQYNLVG